MGSGKIIGINGRTIIQKDFPGGSLHSLAGGLGLPAVLVYLIGNTVVYLGPKIFQRTVHHLNAGIGPGTDSLGFQRFFRIGGRHFAGHYPVKILLQRKRINQPQPVLIFIYGQTAPVGRSPLTSG